MKGQPQEIRLRVPGIAPRFVPAAKEASGTGLRRGLVVVDKPAGMTSHDVVERGRRCVRHKRVGHAGTLDPEVTGVLPLGLGQATRVLHVLLRAGKTYDARMWLHGDVPGESVREVLAAQVGRITQRPPVRSRVKRVERTRQIYELEVAEVAGRDVRFSVHCEAGTYIRKLCHDVGEQLGCGAHMAWLRRTEAGGFTLEDAVNLSALEAACARWHDALDDKELKPALYPLEAALDSARMPRIWLDEGAVAHIASGSPLYVPGVLAYTADVTRDAEVAVQTLSGQLVALGRAGLDAAEFEQATRGVAVRTKRVLWPLPTVEEDASMSE